MQSSTRPPETYSLPNNQRWIGAVGPSSNTPRRRGLPQLTIDINPRENGKVIRPAHMPHMVRKTRVKPALTIGIFPNPTSELYEAVRSPRADSPEPEVSEPPSDLVPNSPVETDSPFKEAYAAHMKGRTEVHGEESAASSALRNCSTCSNAQSRHPDSRQISPSPKPITPWDNKIEMMAQGDPEYRRHLEREYWIDQLQRSGDEGFHDWLHMYSHDIDSPLDWEEGKCTCPWSRDPWFSFVAISRRVRNKIPFPKVSTESMPSTAEAIPGPSRGNGKFKPVDFSVSRADDTQSRPRSPSASKHSSGSLHSAPESLPAAVEPHFSAIHTSEFIPIHLRSPRDAGAQQAGSYPFDLPNRWSSLPGSGASGSSRPWMGASATQHPRTLDVELSSPTQFQQNPNVPSPYSACRGTSLPSSAKAGPAGIGESTVPMADNGLSFPFNLRSPGLTRAASSFHSVDLSRSAQSESINYRAPELTSTELDNDGRDRPSRSNSEILAELGRRNAICDGFPDPNPVYSEYLTASPEAMTDQESINDTADRPVGDRTPRSPRYTHGDLTSLRESLRASGLGSHERSQHAQDSLQSQRFISIDLHSRRSVESAVQDAPPGSNPGSALYIIPTNNELHDDYDVESQTSSANSRIVTDSLISRAPASWLPNRVTSYVSGSQGTAILIVLVVVTDILLFGILYTMVARFHLLVAK